MKFFDHVNHTEQLYGVRAEDLHSWIDGLFDMERFGEFQRSGDREGYDPYSHREFRHCREALEDAFIEFSGTYSQDIIQKVFECHVKDDCQGYLPTREDFTSGSSVPIFDHGTRGTLRSGHEIVYLRTLAK